MHRLSYGSISDVRVLVVDMIMGWNSNPLLPSHLKEGFSAVVGSDHVRVVGTNVDELEIEEFRPELLLLFGSIECNGVDYFRIASAGRRVGSHIAIWLHDDPYEFDFSFRAVEIADTIFTNDRWALEHYDHPRVFHLPLAASPTFHYRKVVPLAQRRYDLFFCGVAFKNRIQMIRELGSRLSRYSTLICGSEWPLDAFPARNWRIPAIELPDYYASSRVVLNLGRDFDLANERYQLPASTPGPRTFEAAMAGALQLYFVTSLEIVEYFEPGAEILLFDQPADVLDTLKTVHNDPDALLPVAHAAQERAMRDHTYAARARTILQTCNFIREQPAKAEAVQVAGASTSE
jgi:spore maturation protein CgeB